MMEKRTVAARTRMTQDRRRLSRLAALLECAFTDGDATYTAVVVNLSFVGAYLSARHLPEKGSNIKINLLYPGAKKSITLQGTVVRGGFGTSEIGILGKFGVKFNGAPLELMSLLTDLTQKGPRQAAHKPKLVR
jgi:hypothetical protein